MKKFLILILICFVQNIFSQTIEEDDILILTVDQVDKTIPEQTVFYGENHIYYNERVDVKSEFPGGSEALERFIKENYKNPKTEVTGRIYASFIIEKDGSLSNIKVLRDIGYGTGAEAIRVLKKSPKWTPAIQNNKQVRVLYSLPITVIGTESTDAAKLHNLTQNSSVIPVIEEENQVYNTAGIEVKPEFPGGLEAFYKFFQQNYRITTDNLKGTIFVTFIIEKDGSLTDIKILRDIGHQTGAEAIRVLRKSPKWTPGIQNNKQVRVLYSFPITIN